MCLFHVLLGLSEKYGWAIHPVHINHKLRDKAADADQHYTEELCKRQGALAGQSSVTAELWQSGKKSHLKKREGKSVTKHFLRWQRS